MSYITDPKGAQFSLFKTETDASCATMVGQRFNTEDGREVMLVYTSSATTLVAGKLYQDAAIVANHQNLTTSTASAGATSVTVTLGATAATANQYAGGFVVFNAGTGAGQTLRIASHPAANASATLVLTLEDPIVTATATASTKSCLIPAHGNNIIISPTTPSGRVAGVGLYPIAASTYGFIVTKGIVSCLADAAASVVGGPISASVTTAGTVTQTPYAANVVTAGVIGSSLQAGVSAEYRTVFIDC